MADGPNISFNVEEARRTIEESIEEATNPVLDRDQLMVDESLEFTETNHKSKVHTKAGAQTAAPKQTPLH